MITVATLKHIASKSADYKRVLEYLIFEHNENGVPLRDEAGNKLMRDQFILDGMKRNDPLFTSMNSLYPAHKVYSGPKQVVFGSPQWESGTAKLSLFKEGKRISAEKDPAGRRCSGRMYMRSIRRQFGTVQ